MIATPLKSQILFKGRALGSSLLQPKGDWVYLCFQYYSHCWNPSSPVTQITLFLSLPPIPNILRASSPVLREVLRYKYFYLMDALGRIAKRAQELEVLDPVPCALCSHCTRKQHDSKARTRGLFLEVPIINGPRKLLLITSKTELSTVVQITW